MNTVVCDQWRFDIRNKVLLPDQPPGDARLSVRHTRGNDRIDLPAIDLERQSIGTNASRVAHDVSN